VRAEEELLIGSCLDIKQTIIVGPFNMVFLVNHWAWAAADIYIYIYKAKAVGK